MFQAIIQDPYNRGRNQKFHAKGYLWDNEDDGTLAMNAFTGGKMLDWIIVDRYISRHVYPTPERLTADT